MARITTAVIPMIQAAESLAEQAPDMLELTATRCPGRSPGSSPASKPPSTPSTRPSSSSSRADPTHQSSLPTTARKEPTMTLEDVRTKPSWDIYEASLLERCFAQMPLELTQAALRRPSTGRLRPWKAAQG
jgi:hypothetical protein